MMTVDGGRRRAINMMMVIVEENIKVVVGVVVGTMMIDTAGIKKTEIDTNTNLLHQNGLILTMTVRSTTIN